MLEAVSRQESRAVYLGEETVLCRVLGKYLMYADAQETGITPHLCMDGYWESWITVVLARTLRPGWHCLDIGANHGYYTLIMADAVGQHGRVAPVEPTPRLAELLRQTLDVNGFPGVTVVQKAASRTDGDTLRLVVPPHRSMNARLSEVAGPDGRGLRRRNRDCRRSHSRMAAGRPDQDRRRGSGGRRLARNAANDRAEPWPRRDPRAQCRPLRGPAELSWKTSSSQDSGFATSISTLRSRTSLSMSYCAGRSARTGCSTSPAAN